MPPQRDPSRLSYSMLALGRRPLPPSLRVGDSVYHLAHTVKHDFFAATAFYDNAGGRRVVLKISRTADYCGLPLLGVGAWLCRRELRFHRALADLPGIPRVLGTLGPTGFVHEYIPGRPLARDPNVPPGFFNALQSLLAQIHRRGIAYVDANKSHNILIGHDNQPYLIDFQISWDLHELGDNPLNRWLLTRLQREDFYHLLKHKRRLRPGELTPQERDIAARRSFLIRSHRFLTRPYFRLRRAIYKRLRDTGRLLPHAGN